MEPPASQRAGRDTSADVLPLLPHDAAYGILLRLLAKDLCRLRTISRAWRSLLSDQHFIADHAARHPMSLLTISYEIDYPAYWNNHILCDIVDLSGRVIKRVHATGGEWVMYMQPERLCIAKGTSMSYQLLNPATGVVEALPEGLAEEHGGHYMDLHHYSANALFGQVNGGLQGALIMGLYNIEINMAGINYVAHPLLVLNDGGIVFACVRKGEGFLRIYNPTDVIQIAYCGAVGLYTGSLLSLTNGSH
ncbi:hypothetical protein BAE44_0002544 [Dichanthelium oligosanthes]|uniref:F-box domain-containing protein n=1 Tax=Dichanthelium oligosanthes TaxID=888268 RepID=A0A1E5WGB7_9POAL|nr:hypothetical protein BAE44_0002544 [Dichanthelium oligosanthes]